MRKRRARAVQLTASRVPRLLVRLARGAQNAYIVLMTTLKVKPQLQAAPAVAATSSR
jgi:hypothetical protein